MTDKKKALQIVQEDSTGAAENKFSKEQLIASGRFQSKRDIVDALLDDGELYTIKTVEEKIEKYMKGKVR